MNLTYSACRTKAITGLRFTRGVGDPDRYALDLPGQE